MGRVRRLASSVLAVLLLPGCATTWAAMELAGADWHQGQTWRETPTGPRERRAALRLEYVANPAPPPQVEGTEPSAAPVGEPPAALADEGAPADAPAPCAACPPRQAPEPTPPPAPVPRGGLRLACEEQGRFATVHVDRELYRYDGVWRVLTAFALLSEAAFAGLSAWQATQLRGGDKSPVPWIVIGSYAALDAIGTAVLMFHPPQTLYRSHDGPGAWKTEATSCEGLALEVAGGAVPTSPDGGLWGWEPWLLQTVLASGDTRVFAQLGQDRVELTPSAVDRCTWARAAGVDHPSCRAFLVGFSGQATLVPLPSDAPTRSVAGELRTAR